MNQLDIAKIFQDKLNQKVISIVDRSKGLDQEVKIVQTDKGKFVLKIPHKEKDKTLKEIVATKLCANKGIPVPKIIFYNESLLIESYIDGVDLDDLKTSKENFEAIYFKIGQLMKVMHSIKGQNFGPVNKEKLIGEKSTQKEFIYSWLPPEIDSLEKTDYYSKKDLSKIKDFFESNKYILSTKESVLLHSDIADQNIIIQERGISGIIDFGDLSTGPAMQDFAFMYIDHFGDYKFEKLLEGYGKHNLKEIRFYAFCWMLWLIGSKIEKKEFDKKYERMNKLFREIWS